MEGWEQQIVIFKLVFVQIKRYKVLTVATASYLTDRRESGIDLLV